MIKVLLIDDEYKARKTLGRLLNRFCPEVEIIGEAESAERGIELIKQLSPDILFLDIEMGTGDGFSLIEETSDCKYEVILVTAYPKYAVKAFGFSVADYLLKPIEITRLQAAVGKVCSIVQRKNTPIAHTRLNKITLPTSNGYQLFDIDRIIRCEADGSYTKIFMSDKSSVLVSKTLKEFEETLTPKSFFRTHRHHLINLNHVSKYLIADGGKLLLSDGSSIGVSFRKRNSVLEALKDLV